MVAVSEPISLLALQTYAPPPFACRLVRVSVVFEAVGVTRVEGSCVPLWVHVVEWGVGTA